MGTRQIPLSQGMFAIVDEADYDFLSQWKWFAHKERNTFYALRNASIRGGNKRSLIAMHRVILGVDDPKIPVDHADGNGLLNTRANLRTCTNVQNLWNRRADRRSLSHIKGVGFHKKSRKWRARITDRDGREVYLGIFPSIEEAKSAYVKAAIELRGDFAGVDKLDSISVMST